MAILGTLAVTLSAKTEAFAKGMASAKKHTMSVRDNVAQLNNGLRQLKILAAGAMSGFKISNEFARSVQMAAGAQESENLFLMSMGKYANEARIWTDQYSDALRMNSYEIRRTLGLTNVMLNSMGFAEQQAYDMSKQIVSLAQDMASYYNIDLENAFMKLRGGLVGEIRPLRDLGIAIDESAVKVRAMADGVRIGNTEMSFASKVYYRYLLILEQTTKAQGDMWRTMNSTQNAIRGMHEQIDMTRILLGQGLSDVVGKIAVKIRDWLNENKYMFKEWGKIIGAVALKLAIFVKNLYESAKAHKELLATIVKVVIAHNVLKRIFLATSAIMTGKLVKGIKAITAAYKAQIAMKVADNYMSMRTAAWGYMTATQVLAKAQAAVTLQTKIATAAMITFKAVAGGVVAVILAFTAYKAGEWWLNKELKKANDEASELQTALDKIAEQGKDMSAEISTEMKIGVEKSLQHSVDKMQNVMKSNIITDIGSRAGNFNVPIAKFSQQAPEFTKLIQDRLNNLDLNALSSALSEEDFRELSKKLEYINSGAEKVNGLLDKYGTGKEFFISEDDLLLVQKWNETARAALGKVQEASKSRTDSLKKQLEIQKSQADEAAKQERIATATNEAITEAGKLWETYGDEIEVLNAKRRAELDKLEDIFSVVSGGKLIDETTGAVYNYIDMRRNINDSFNEAIDKAEEAANKEANKLKEEAAKEVEAGMKAFKDIVKGLNEAVMTPLELASEWFIDKFKEISDAVQAAGISDAQRDAAMKSLNKAYEEKRKDALQRQLSELGIKPVEKKATLESLGKEFARQMAGLEAIVKASSGDSKAALKEDFLAAGQAAADQYKEAVAKLDKEKTNDRTGGAVLSRYRSLASYRTNDVDKQQLVHLANIDESMKDLIGLLE